jgi:hypothetical protein
MPDFRNTITQNGVAVELAGHSHAGMMESGAAFPASPAANTLFFHSNLGVLCQFDGTRWFGARQIITPFLSRTAGPPWTTAGGVYYCRLPAAIIYAELSSLYVAGTNNATNYWSLAVKFGSTTFYTITTAAFSANVEYSVNHDIIQNVLSGGQIFFDISKTGTPGAISVYSQIEIRRVYT